MEPELSSVLWIVIVGFIIAFVLAFGIGANDVANSFGTSVGAKVLTLRQACIVAAIFELLGAILLGSKVSDTVRKGIIDINMFNGKEKDAMVGALSALSGTSIWLIVATFFKLPVSGTHSVVGATIGYALVESGAKGIQWSKFGMIAASWVISPVMSGLISSGIFILIRRFILQKSNPFKQGLRSLPLFYGITLSINVFSIFYDSPDILGIGKMELYIVIGISLSAGFLIFLLVHFVVAPWLKKRILAEEQLQPNYALTEEEPNDVSNVPEVQLNDEMPDRNGDIVNKERQQENGILQIQKMSDLLKTNIEPDEITIASSLPSDDRENTASNENSLQNTTMLDIPKLNGITKCVAVPDEIVVITPNENEIARTENEVRNDIFDFDERTPCSTVPTTPALGRRTDEIGLVKAPRKMSKAEKSEQQAKKKKEKETARQIARSLVSDEPKTARLFKFLQVMTASFGAFAHGGNDVSNAIGPVISIWIIYRTGLVQSKAATPIWILIYGGVGIIIGLCVWGRRVIETIGENLTPVTPTSGFCIEIGAAFTVLVASNLGIPVSTTHCKVGSVVFTGRVRSRDVVDWSLFVNIVISWVVTMPVTVLAIFAHWGIFRARLLERRVHSFFVTSAAVLLYGYFAVMQAKRNSGKSNDRAYD